MKYLEVGIIASVCALTWMGGCPAPQDSGLNANSNGQVLGATAENSDASQSSDQAAATGSNSVELIDRLNGYGDYRLYKLGASAPGDQWTVSLTKRGGAPLVVVLLDENQQLLMRQYVSSSTPLTHIVRSSTGETYVGVTTQASVGTDVSLLASRVRGLNIPGPRPQVVYLNFAGGQGVKVHNADPISFGAFDSAILGGDYAGQTAQFKRVILETLQTDYGPYNVTFYTSDSGPPPAPYSVLHFGGYADALLGLADSVDSYNSLPSEEAVIYVESFATYAALRLTNDEMALMIGNVASHELGHLLGLYHTMNPTDVMDTTGTALDLAAQQAFSRAKLETSVFPTGFENSPVLLRYAVGDAPGGAAKPSTEKSAQLPMKIIMRRLARQELQSGCGTCMHLNDPPRE